MTDVKSIQCSTGKRHAFVAQRPLRFRLVDIFGEPMPALHVGVGEGVRTGKHADEDATVTHPTAPRKSKVTVADGRRIVFREFDFHVPVTHDPADIERELGEDAFLAKNDVHEDDPRLLLHGNAAVDDDGVEALES